MVVMVMCGIGLVPHGVGAEDDVDVDGNDILLKKWRNAPIDKQRQREKLRVLKSIANVACRI